MEAISENKEIIQFENREYVISHSNINTDTGKRIIVAMKDIQNAMDKTEFDSWHKLVRVLTHEIMNSITPIISLSDTLCDMASTNIMDESDTIKEGLGVIHRRSQGLLTFVENYRKLTRVTLPIKTKIMVSELFADIQKLYTQPYISFQIENADTDSIYADRGQMEQVIINLLNNAIDAVPTSNARIICSFRTESSGSSYHSIISITNNGKVILPEVLERVFVPFFSTKKNGSGIGLSLCKQIIMNHGGDITICSDNDTGTTVEIKL
jgi:signal transduction histidine kinase